MRLHEAMGFLPVGVYEKVGCKLGSLAFAGAGLAALLVLVGWAVGRTQQAG